MEITCTRCHQAVEAENCYCPTCGLPQLQYSAENVPGQAPPERWLEPVQDASIVDWKRAMPTAILLAIPAGFLCPMLYPMGFLGLFLDGRCGSVDRGALSAQPKSGVDYGWCGSTNRTGDRPAGRLAGVCRQWRHAFCGPGCVAHEGNTIDEMWNERFVLQD